MKKPLYLNRRLFELDLFEQNKYLGYKINTIKLVIITKSSSIDYKNYFSNNNILKRQIN